MEPRPIDPEKVVRKSWQHYLSGSPVLVLCILVHLLFILLATLFIVQRVQKNKKAAFTEVSVSAATQKVEKKQSMAQMQSSQPSPELDQRITTKDMSPVSLPDVNLPAETPADNPGEANSKLGGAMLGSSGLAAVTPETQPVQVELPNTVVSAFGSGNSNGKGLVGVFYDLKQTSKRNPSDVNVGNYASVIADFMNTGWRSNYFEKFYKGPGTLHLSQLMIPYQAADNGPKAYNMQDTVKPGCWVALYEGKISVPVGGTFRFVGYGDDVCEVALNRKTVLNGGWMGRYDETGKDDSNKLLWQTGLSETIKAPGTFLYHVIFPIKDVPAYKGNASLPMVAGSWFTLEPDNTYVIQILIGEHPGGAFGAWLMVEEKDHDYQKTSTGFPILPLFQLDNVAMPKDINAPPFDKQVHLGWQSVEDPITDNSN